MADESYSLYWMSNKGQGQWVFSEEGFRNPGYGFLAAEQAGASPTGTELPWTSRSWRTWGVPVDASGDDSCQWANDGECDEPANCAAGTDTSDCGSGGWVQELSFQVMAEGARRPNA